MLILRPAVSNLKGAKQLMCLTGVLFLLWVCLLWRGNTLARRMSENELVVQLLRKLGVGLLLLDEDGLIMAANDKAENVLCMFLPHLNIWRLRMDEGFRQERQPSDPTVRVSELIFPRVVVEREGALERIEYRSLWDQRLRGRPAVFYARMRNRPADKTWVKITAAPVVIKRRGRKTLTTSLSAMDPVQDERTLKRLEALVPGTEEKP